jgi:hypothetical protein
MRPLKSPKRFRAFGEAGGRQPFMPYECLANPFDAYPFGFADCEADAAAFRRARREAPFIQRRNTMPQFRFSVNDFQKKFLGNGGVGALPSARGKRGPQA